MLRASLRSLLSRKLRLTFAVVAIVLGVSFLSGAFVLTDSLGARFERLYSSINQNVDVQVTLTANAENDNPQPLLTQQDLDRLAAVDGVAGVSGDVSALGVVPFDLRDGEPVRTSGPPQLGVGVTGQDDPLRLIELADGRWPSAASEVALSRYTAEQAHAGLGDRIRVYLPGATEARESTVVGIAVYSGDRPSLAGETLVAFPLADAQRLFYGETGRYSGASFRAAAGVSQEQLRDRMAAAVPTGFEAKTGAQANADEATEVQRGLSQLATYFFGPFAIVALLVGIFLIFNTFNILVAQRTRELALFRAMGASWGQVTGSVLVEAVLIGLVGATLGLLGGIGLGYAGSAAIGSFGGGQLPAAGVRVGPVPIVLAYTVGVLVTVAAAFLPAMRASAVPPLAAMRDVTNPDKPLRGLSIVAASLALPGAAMLAVALAVGTSSGYVIAGIWIGMALVFAGIGLLSPLLTRPVAGVVGRVVAWGVSGRLGVANVLRNPRRTSVTAAALMIGVALVSAASVVGHSFTTSIDRTVTATLGAEVVIQTDLSGVPGETGYSEEALRQVREIPEVDQMVPFWVSRQTRAEGATPPFGGTFAVEDLAVVRDMFAMEAVAGTLNRVGPGELATDENTAKTHGWQVGETVRLKADKGDAQPYRLVGIYEATPILTDTMFVSTSAVEYFAGPLVYQGYISLDEGADTEAVITRIEQIMNDFPLVRVGDRSSLVEELSTLVDTALAIITVLLGVAILIALLGIINTLLLSIYERTRELGMLRAVGMSRRGVTGMVVTESVVLSVFGCLLGIALGVGLGVVLTLALGNIDLLNTVAIPWTNLLVFVAVAAVAGVLAALWPAWRAARLDVLRAIAYE
jgi:putative ABC transport system permease protein